MTHSAWHTPDPTPNRFADADSDRDLSYGLAALNETAADLSRHWQSQPDGR